MEVLEIGSYLKIKREELGMSMYKLAKDSGLSHTYISQLEKGLKQNPSPEILKRLATWLNIDYMELMFMAGHVQMKEIDNNFIGMQQAAAINNFLEKSKGIIINENGMLLDSVKDDLKQYILSNKLSGFTENLFLQSLRAFYEEIIETIKTKGDTIACLNHHQDIRSAQHYLFNKYLSNSTLRSELQKYMNLLLGDRNHDFYGQIENEVSEQIRKLLIKYNVTSNKNVTISDTNGFEDDIAAQVVVMILDVDNAQFQWDVLQELQDIAHEYHIKWNSAFEVGARQPRSKKLETIIQTESLTYNDKKITNEDRQRILEMLKLLFPEQK